MVWDFVGLYQEAVNRGLQVRKVEHAPLEAARAELGEEAFHGMSQRRWSA
jgi:hypothetical protein